MSLSTFGAIMGFAAEMVEQREGVYKAMVEKAKNTALKETLQSLLNEAQKSHSLMEQTRRENVTEMILEPIEGLQKEDYRIDMSLTNPPDDAGLLQVALLLEEMAKKFFQEASLKIPLPEVSRIFRKIAQRKEKNIEQLQSLRLNL